MNRRPFLCFAFALIVASAIVQVRSGSAGDKGWLLLAARMWLDGKVLYVDIFELDPPFIVWLYAIPEWLSRHLPFPDYALLGVMGLIFCALSVLLCDRLMRFHPMFAGDSRRRLDFAVLLALVFVFFNTQVYFADREHIFLVLAFPYMLRFMPSLARQRLPVALRIAVGALAAIGFCVKPYTIIVFAILQLLYVVRERRSAILFSLENGIIYLGGAVYLLCVWLFARPYIDSVMPVAMATYSGFNRRVNGYLYLPLAFVSAGLNFIELRPGDGGPYRRDSYYIIGLCAAYLAYALVNNGWGYTFNPLLCMLIFAGGWMLWDYGWLRRNAPAEGRLRLRFASGMRGCIANLAIHGSYMILCLVTFYTTASCGNYSECSINNRYLTYFREHSVHSFGALEVNLRIFTSLARRTGASWDTRFHSLWMLPELLQEGDPLPANHRWIVDFVGKGLAEDLNGHKPDIVFVDANNAVFGYPHPVDMIAYFSRVPEFREAWRHYAYSTTIDQCPAEDPKINPPPIHIDCRFAIYSRVQPAIKANP